MNFDFIRYEIQDRIATITLARPEKRNAMHFDLIAELKQAFSLAENNPLVKIVVLRGSSKAFSAGADLGYLQQLQHYDLAQNLADSKHLMELYLQIYNLRKVVIALVEGHAIAGGCGLVTVADFAFAVPEVKFGYTEVKIGFIPAIVSIFLIRKIGEAHARRLLLTGDLISAEEAYRVGLVTQLYSPEKIESEVTAFAQRLCKENAQGSMEITKRLIKDLPSMPLENALEFAAKMNAHVRGSDECKKGISAFLNKENLQW